MIWVRGGVYSVSVVYPAFGTKRIVREVVLDMLGRAFGDCRLVVISKKSASGAGSVLDGCDSSLVCVSRGSRNVCSTVGGKVGGSMNE